MTQKSIPSFISYLQDSRKYIWIFLFSQLFPACFFILNNGKVLSSITKSSEFVKVGLATIVYLAVFIAIGYIAKYFFAKGYKKILTALIILNFIGNGIELYIYLNFATTLTLEVMSIILETNKNEAQEFLGTYFNSKLIILLIYYSIGILMFFDIKKQVFLTGFFLGGIVIFVLVNFFNIPGAFYVEKNHIYPRAILNYIGYHKNIDEMNNLMSTFEERYKDIQVIDEAVEATYVFIIGESFSRNHSSLFGYPRETSPNLQKRYNAGELFKFDDVVSPHHETKDAVLKLVSEYAHDSGSKFGESMNVIDLFKKAGYKTYWLSNQNSFGDKGVGINLMVKRAEVSEFTENYMPGLKDRIGLDDTSLLPLLEKALAEKEKKKFIIIHLYGSHYAYKQRYPQEYAYFDDNEEPDYFSDLQKKNKKIVNQYHNALRFNDYVVDQIIKTVDSQSQNSFILYISDHGEIVYDENIDAMGHVPPNISMKNVEIPMVVWASEYYREHNKEKIARIKAAEDKPFASEDVIYPIIDLANLKYEGYKPEKNLFEDSFKEKPRQISNDGLFYKKGPEKDYVDIESND